MSYRLDIDPTDPKSIDRALKTEWLLTNGLGGYAMGTALGVNTRRYHGLLVAATKPPVGRVVALHSMIEQLEIGDATYDLATHQFGHDLLLHPSGYKHLRSATWSPSDAIAWHYEIGALSVIRSVRLEHDAQVAVVTYTLDNVTEEIRFRARPMTPLRDFHALKTGHESSPKVHDRGILLAVDHGDSRLHIGMANVSSNVDPEQWHSFAYSLDRLRCQDWIEDIWSPWRHTATLYPANRWVIVLLAALTRIDQDFPRFQVTRADQDSTSDTHTLLGRVARQFVVNREHSGHELARSVIAGYPWFTDWGRDTMISLPGLMLCTGRFEEARSCVLLFAQHMRNGLIPNFFDDSGEGAHYNTVDASLWFVHAVHELWRSNTIRVDSELLAACRAVIAAYRDGTDFNIRMDSDGLIAAGDETTQLTWMDAKRDGVVFTPRHGKAVEINALWYNALRCLADMTDDERERDELMVLSTRVAKSFVEQFWWSERQCLHDVLIPGHARGEDASERRTFIADGKLRSNQIFAASLPVSPLDDDQKRAVVQLVGRRLLTPFGLRTLDRDDPNYRGRYEGNMFERDRAYHNGTVWPWLIGPYCEAMLRVENFSEQSKERVRAILQPLLDELQCERTENGRYVGGCLGQLAEVYDGDPPQRPGGCPAQAWSVAEVLRILTLLETTDEHG